MDATESGARTYRNTASFVLDPKFTVDYLTLRPNPNQVVAAAHKDVHGVQHRTRINFYAVIVPLHINTDTIKDAHIDDLIIFTLQAFPIKAKMAASIYRKNDSV